MRATGIQEAHSAFVYKRMKTCIAAAASVVAVVASATTRTGLTEH
jgi:hypothetical protein